MDYYRDRHMPMLKERMGDACLYCTIDSGLGGGRPGSPPAYTAMRHIHCTSVDTFNAAYGPHVKAVLADVPNYTDLQPVSPSCRSARWWSSARSVLRVIRPTGAYVTIRTHHACGTSSGPRLFCPVLNQRHRMTETVNRTLSSRW